jgi:hypothetical protein
METTTEKKTFFKWLGEKNMKIQSKNELKKLNSKPYLIVTQGRIGIETDINFDRISQLNPAHKLQIVTFLQTAIEELKK